MAKSLKESMVSAAGDAVKLTDAYFCEVLDYSQDSIATIERLVDDIKYSMPGGPKQENIDLLCRVWGAYVGEVFRRHVDGEWINWEDQFGKAIAFESGGVKLFPYDKVRKRLTIGPEHNLKDYYAVFRDQMSLDE